MAKGKKEESPEVELKPEGTVWTTQLKNMLFTEVLGIPVFNASYFLYKEGFEDKTQEPAIEKYKVMRADFIQIYANIMKRKPEDLFVVTKEGETMIHNSLAVDFGIFFNAQFAAYCSQRMFELFNTGATFSDDALVDAMFQRFPVDSIKNLLDKLQAKPDAK